MNKKKDHQKAALSSISHDDYNSQISLFSNEELPLPPPKLPSRFSRPYRLLCELARGASITQLEWLYEGEGWRLAADVKELKYKGWEVFSHRVRFGKARIARYKLSPACLPFIGGISQ